MKPYKKHFDHSYAFGAFAVYELLLARPEQARAVYIHSHFKDDGKLRGICAPKNVPVIMDDRAFERVRAKDNSYVLAVFDKYMNDPDGGRPHLCLVNPMDMGNLGAICRSMAAFSVLDLAVITPAADIFDPKTVRASMGALFRLNVRQYATFDEYHDAYKGRVFYPFMTDGAMSLADVCPKRPYTLIFGNEAAGLPPHFAHLGQSLCIPQSSRVDSLNLSAAVSIGLYEFSRF